MSYPRGIEVREGFGSEVAGRDEILVRVTGPDVRYIRDAADRIGRGGGMNRWWLFTRDGDASRPWFSDSYSDWAWSLYQRALPLLDEIDSTATIARIERDPVAALQQRVQELERQLARVTKRGKR